jgi:hypothetical protein
MLINCGCDLRFIWGEATGVKRVFWKEERVGGCSKSTEMKVNLAGSLIAKQGLRFGEFVLLEKWSVIGSYHILRFFR